MMEKIKVAIVGNQRLIRDSIAIMLSETNDIQTAGSFSSGEQLLDNLEDLQPDVVLIDALVGGITSLEVTEWIKEKDQRVKVILLSTDSRKEYVAAGIQSGIDGYLTKDVQFDALLKSIRMVCDGQKYFPDVIKLMVFEDFYNRTTAEGLPNEEERPGIGQLTQRQLEVFQLAVAAKSNREIADDLRISVKTVETHKLHIYNKLGLRSTAELIKYAMKSGHGITD